MTDSSKDSLYKICEQFILTNKIRCPETIGQSDRVIENAYDLIGEICDAIGYYNDDSDRLIKL